jgi:hypothetical protein
MASVPVPVAQAVAERRLGLRIPVDQPARISTGWHSFPARLTELSLTGCRLRCEDPVAAGRSVWLWLPRGFGGRLPHPVRADVIRAESEPGQATGMCEVALQFRPRLARTHRRLARVMTEILSGESERRRDERVPYRRRVIARGPDRPRVLIGQDLSLGGMRISDPEDFPTGTEVQIALHAGGALAPLVVGARVVRNDGAAGAGLVFVDLDETRREQLSKLIHAHAPFIGPDGRPAVVSEIVCEPCESSPGVGEERGAADPTPWE